MTERDCIISLFIDNELSLGEKIEFVARCREEPPFAEEALALLDQEKLLRAGVPAPVGQGKEAPLARPRRRLPVPGLVAAAVLLAFMGVAAGLVLGPAGSRPAAESAPAGHRFVIYEPSSAKVEIAGSFTGWRKVGLEPIPGSGYWEITLDVPPGNHTYTYILDDSRKIADPTVPESESDDFGGWNSVLVAAGREI